MRTEGTISLAFGVTTMSCTFYTSGRSQHRARFSRRALLTPRAALQAFLGIGPAIQVLYMYRDVHEAKRERSFSAFDADAFIRRPAYVRRTRA
jgi:hypothetical protein